jgi:hypothetical protein
MLKSVVRFIHPQVQEAQFWILPISTNIELGLDIGQIHFHIHTELQASQSIHS